MVTLILVASCVGPPRSSVARASNAEVDLLSGQAASQFDRIIAERRCPCRCGSYLPGSLNSPACFGCTVGKAEVSRIIDYLAIGKSLSEIALELDGPVLIDVYADYNDPDLPAVWRLVKRVADSFDAKRVILRPLARGEFERTAIALVEFARENGKYEEAHTALIDHAGPWDASALAGIARRIGLDAREAVKFMRTVDLDAQINKDRQHARLGGVKETPAIYVNGKPVARDAEALRRAIRNVMLDDSM